MPVYMIPTHIFLCGRWVWRLLTLAQWRAMPHAGRHLATVKAAKLTGVLICAGGVGVALPPMLDRGPAPIVSRAVPVNVPEPWPGAVLGIGLAGLAVARRAPRWSVFAARQTAVAGAVMLGVARRQEPGRESPAAAATATEDDAA